MKTRILIAIVAAICVLLSLEVVAQSSGNPSKGRPQNAAPNVTKPGDQAHSSKVVAYYFHGTFRCVTCRKIENLSHDVVNSSFAEQLKTGQLQWQAVNMELPQNMHFIKDYQLVTSSLVLVKYESGKSGYKNLQDVWKFVNNERAFRNYVKGEVQAALGTGQ